MEKMIIGISGNERRDGEFVRSYVNKDYVEAVKMGGGIPVILPLIEDSEALDYYIESIDGLILSGGHDIHPECYGEELLPECHTPHRLRDTFDMLLLEKAMKRGIPVLGVCRGMQVINVYLGGSLFQDLSHNRKNLLKHDQADERGMAVQKLKIDKRSKLHEVLGGEVWINSFHHQQVKKLGRGLHTTGRSSDSGVELIETLEGEGFLMGVQWHPEMMAATGSEEMQRVFTCFIGEAANKKRRG